MIIDLQLDSGYVISRSTRSGHLGGGIHLLPWDAVAAGEVLPWESPTNNGAGRHLLAQWAP